MKTPLRILVVAASLAVAAPLYAQGGGGGGGGGMQQMTPERCSGTVINHSQGLGAVLFPDGLHAGSPFAAGASAVFSNA